MTSDARAALEAGDDGFHEIQLNGKQLVFLGMATTLVSVVIFLCGVLVGRGVKPIDTVAQAAGPQAFDVPVTSVASVAPGAIAAPVPAAPGPSKPAASATAAAAASAPAEDDTQPTPLGDEAEASPAPAVAAPVASAPAKPVVPAPAKPTPTPAPAVAPVKPAPAQAAAVPPAVARPAPVSTATPAPAPATQGGAIAVQVGAFRTRPEADALARRLSSRGYAVYVLAPTGDGKAVYRVRVGNYASADEAQKVSARLTQQEKLTPWITR